MVERIVSLAPSATNTIDALDAADSLVGRTDHCRGSAPSLGGWLTPDLDQLEDLEPELVITTDTLQRSISETIADLGYATAHFEPATLSDVFETIHGIGTAIDRASAADELIADLQNRLSAVRQRVPARPNPVVYCEEWQAPPMVAGNWVPDAVKAAGGAYPWLDSGERSQQIDAETVEQIDPDHIILHVCGQGTAVEPTSIQERGWSLSAVADGRITVIDDHYLNQPAPSLIDGIERLAAVLYPPELEG